QLGRSDKNSELAVVQFKSCRAIFKNFQRRNGAIADAFNLYVFVGHHFLINKLPKIIYVWITLSSEILASGPNCQCYIWAETKCSAKQLFLWRRKCGSLFFQVHWHSYKIFKFVRIIKIKYFRL
ncbi:unnamed protein product, partial [Ixodes persulcatus]